jgi:hypothetical protein
MRLLPREHGATVIWACSVMLAFAALPALPAPLPALAFLALALVVLLAVSAATFGSRAVRRLERHGTLLPAASGALTALFPAGHGVMAGTLAPPVAGAWILFLGTTVLEVSLARAVVRGLLGKPAVPPWRLAPAFAALAATAIALVLLRVLPAAALASLAPVPALAISLRLRPPSRHPRASGVRDVGLRMSASLLAFVVVVVAALRLG